MNTYSRKRLVFGDQISCQFCVPVPREIEAGALRYIEFGSIIIQVFLECGRDGFVAAAIRADTVLVFQGPY